MQCTGSTVQVTGTDTRLSKYSVSVGTVLNRHGSPNTSNDTNWQYRPTLARILALKQIN